MSVSPSVFTAANPSTHHYHHHHQLHGGSLQLRLAAHHHNPPLQQYHHTPISEPQDGNRRIKRRRTTPSLASARPSQDTHPHPPRRHALLKSGTPDETSARDTRETASWPVCFCFFLEVMSSSDNLHHHQPLTTQSRTQQQHIANTFDSTSLLRESPQPPTSFGAKLKMLFCCGEADYESDVEGYDRSYSSRSASGGTGKVVIVSNLLPPAFAFGSFHMLTPACRASLLRPTSVAKRSISPECRLSSKSTQYSPSFYLRFSNCSVVLQGEIRPRKSPRRRQTHVPKLATARLFALADFRRASFYCRRSAAA